jgi:hypothetical protein
MPEHFEVSLLPSKISSWLTSMLQRLPAKVLLQKRHRTMGLEVGEGGSNTVNLLDAMTFTWTGSPSKREFSCWELLPWLSERTGLSSRVKRRQWLTTSLLLHIKKQLHPLSGSTDLFLNFMTLPQDCSQFFVRLVNKLHCA